MANHSMTIEVQLIDGDSDGLIRCSLDQWKGVIYVIPIDPNDPLMHLKRCDEFNNFGVYFLISAEEDFIYIGQVSERKNGYGLRRRLDEHKDKGYWKKATAAKVVFFTTNDDSFGKTEISILENRFWNMAKDTGRCTVYGNEPPQGGGTDRLKDSLEKHYIENAIKVMNTLSLFGKVFQPKQESDPNPPACGSDIIPPKAPIDGNSAATFEDEHEDILIDPEFSIVHKCRRTKEEKVAHGKRSTNGFTVLEGSEIALDEVNVIPDHIKERRNEAKNKGIVDENGILKKKQPFRSASFAGGFVIGGPVAGTTKWKTADGRTLKEVEDEERSQKNIKDEEDTLKAQEDEGESE